MADPHAGWIAVGQILGAFGFQGEMRVKPLGGSPERFRDLKRVFVGEDHAPADIIHRRTVGPGAILRLSTVKTRDAARALFQTYLYVPEAEAAPLPEGEYFVHQIIGLTVITPEGETLGTVREVLHTGSNDVYLVDTTEPHGGAERRGEVRRGSGTRQGQREVLVPALKDIVHRIDLEAKTMEVTLPPGLLD